MIRLPEILETLLSNKLYLNKMDKTYNYKVDTTKSFEQQHMSEKTKAIFANILEIIGLQIIKEKE